MKNQEFITNSFEETQKVGENFIGSIPAQPGQGYSLSRRKALVIALYGELGSGKTTFVQGLAKGLGIKRRIISPTFIIMRTYEIRFKIYDLRFKNFYHVDLYRVENVDDIKGLGIEEIIDNPQNIVAIEWAERIGKLLPKPRVDIYFEYLREDKRKIVIKQL
ncbi:MAG: tRNA (adenosine(37)-N6)-threonylcarbamoyltransferase complex ATPase subunit type 1 TsaE [Candidatus Levybacteria bacterium]|nr:tRNA (adenosine(37)-N6)-threonylcarbamoyltransferase complex ATPase subunit type 1 TsaE [Candidatus Levybacteria bacterium]